MANNFTDFTMNDGFSTWASSGDISSSTDRVRPPPPGPAAPPRPQRAPRAARTPRTPRPTRPARAPPAPHKRPHYDTTSSYGEPPAKRAAPSIRVGSGFKWNLQTLAAAADAVESGGKSPVSALNELGVRVAYSVLRQGGPAHCPSFHVAVTVADLRFSGWGHSKREARAAAARACLAALLARAGRVLPAPSPHQDFTSDEPHRFPVSEFQCLEPKVRAMPPPEPAPLPAPLAVPASAPIDVTNGKEAGADSGSPASLFGAAGVGAAHKSPINVLYENYSGLAFTCTFGDGSPLSETQAPLQLSHSMRFKVVCQIKEHKFEGYGSSKKLAKLAAARSALAALEDTRRDSPPCPLPAGALHQTLADHIGKLVNEKFNELMKNDLLHSKRKVLAGIVITTHNRIEDARVIAVTTGTKCVSGEHMSVTGRAVNDCHAEVAARRCLQRHLYAQLLMYVNQPDPTRVLEESDVEPVAGGGFQLKASRGVHLYVSTAPCGDGRIFSPHEHHHAEPDKHPNRLARGQLRTKIESGEGTIPVKNCNNVLQTWDGVMQGERLLTMSCSDKVARWSVCGLQGALLSRLLRPVYLQSLVLGSLLHPHHMYRAICGRFEAYISSLPPPFHLQRPLLARAASTEARTPARAPSFSVCWCATQQLPEVINATTGKLENGQPSLLCKQSMFARWHYLVKRLPLLPQDVEPGAALPEMPDKPDALLYNEAKQMCPTYQLAKQRLISAFDKAKLGRWIKRPLEQDQFVCEVADAAPSLLFAWAGVAAPPGPPAPPAPPARTSGRHTHGSTHTLQQVNNNIHLPKSNQSSISSRLLRARINNYNLSNNRSILNRDKFSFSVDDDNYNYWRVGKYNYKNDEDSDDEIDSKQNNCNDSGNVSITSNDGRVITALKDDLNVKVTEKSQTNRIHNDKDIKEIKNRVISLTSQISNLNLGDEKKQFWNDSYRRRYAKRVDEHAKDTKNDFICAELSNAVDGFDNLSDSIFEDIDVNSSSLRLHTRRSIRPRVLQTKEKQTDESISKSNVVDVLENRAQRDSKVVALVKLKDTVVKDKNLELLKQPEEVRLNNNDLTFEDDEKENIESNEIPREKSSSGGATLTNPLLLRRLQLYEMMRAKNK